MIAIIPSLQNIFIPNAQDSLMFGNWFKLHTNFYSKIVRQWLWNKKVKDQENKNEK